MISPGVVALNGVLGIMQKSNAEKTIGHIAKSQAYDVKCND